MSSVLLAAGVVILLWSLTAERLDRWRLVPALLIAVGGVLTSVIFHVDLAAPLYSPITERAVEMVLALLLFVDATEVRGGLLGHDGPGVLRLTVIALPLSVIAATVVGAFLLPTTSLAVLLMIACAVMPTDLSPMRPLFANDRVPEKVRHLLNVESGYNDGVVAPVFVLALLMVEGQKTNDSFAETLAAAITSAAVSVAVGAAAGFVIATAAGHCLSRGLTSARALGIAVVLAALLTYGIASELEGNGFVAAFVCGIVYRLAGEGQRDPVELEFAEDVALLCNLLVWFAFGLVLDYVFTAEVMWSWMTVFAILAVTVLRFVPVWLSLVRSRYTRRERILIAGLGPRGTASIVFGLLAWTKLAGDDVDDASLVLIVVALTVTVSLIGYSVVAPALAARPRSKP
ncbi:cation:proton antiporter [Gordonia phthalatica]|uniref:Cation/H+ exchanger transmembrane domain-containing protein n=1 Tax=Gordonia phthalatica TaxID=1136941 RepID=A0A0N9N0H3_9ACTN|nr:cation:proton antiporter [Gordonia phthalatica]ALG84069.1 hypothetical protein ACH46_05570 [Gordonia phthalatica]